MKIKTAEKSYDEVLSLKIAKHKKPTIAQKRRGRRPRRPVTNNYRKTKISDRTKKASPTFSAGASPPALRTNYNTNRQRKQVLCRFSFVADSRGRLSLQMLC